MPEVNAIQVESFWVAIAGIVVPICVAIVSTALIAIYRMGRILSTVEHGFRENSKEHATIVAAQSLHGDRLTKVESSINHGILPIAERRIGVVEEKHDKLSHKVARLEVGRENE